VSECTLMVDCWQSMYFFYGKWDLQIIVDSKVGGIRRCFSYWAQECLDDLEKRKFLTLPGLEFTPSIVLKLLYLLCNFPRMYASIILSVKYIERIQCWIIELLFSIICPNSSVYCLRLDGCFFRFHLPEDVSSKFYRNVGEILPEYMLLYSRIFERWLWINLSSEI
jgi:hypothetical protein